MDAKREQVFVGLFVVIAAALLIVAVYSISGAFAGPALAGEAAMAAMAARMPGRSVWPVAP